MHHASDFLWLVGVLVCVSVAVCMAASDGVMDDGGDDADYTPRHLTNEQASFFQSFLATTPISRDRQPRAQNAELPDETLSGSTESASLSSESSSSWFSSSDSSASGDATERNKVIRRIDGGGEENDDSSEYYDYGEDDDDYDEEDHRGTGKKSDDDSNESLPRLLSQSAFNRISETLGALNTVGHLLVDMTRGGNHHETPRTEPYETTTSGGLTSDTSSSFAPLTSVKIFAPAAANASLSAPVNDTGVSVDQTADKRISHDEPDKPMFVETKETKKRKKKTKNKNKNKAKKPLDNAAGQPGAAPIQSAAVQRPVATTAANAPISSTTKRPLAPTIATSTARATVKPATDLTALASEDSSAKDVENRCRTPSGGPGRCEDLSSCPALLLNLSSLRESLCFKSLFVPGVCCPIQESAYPTTTTQRPLKLTTKSPQPHGSATTTRRPTHRPQQVSSPNLVLIPQLSSTTTTTTTRTPLETGNELVGVNDNNIIDSEECGQQEYSTGRIVGGVEAPNGQWPWMAAIFLHGPKRTEFWCGGSLIGSKYILTAAHCTRDSRQKPFAARQFTVRLGDIDLSTDAEPSAPVTFAVKEVRAHERFSRIGFYNDIAVLVLDKPVRKSKYVIPLCLPRAGRMPPAERLPGRRATVVGWGTTYYGGKESTTQRQAELPVWRNEDCDRSYFQPINENFICAGYSDGGVDACQGDSGGPLMMRYETRWIQLGVVSFGNKCGEPGYPGVYTRISQYLDWISDHTRD